MDKKTYLLKLLNSLKDVRSLAEGFIVLIEHDAFDDEMLSVLAKALETAITTTSNKLTQMKLQKWVHFLENLKKLEEEQKSEDESDLSQLDDLLAQM